MEWLSNTQKMKNTLKIFNLLTTAIIFITNWSIVIAQTEEAENLNTSKFKVGINIGYDLPQFTNNYTYYKLNGGLKFGFKIDYNISRWGIGINYDRMINTPKSSLNNVVYYDTLLSPMSSAMISTVTTNIKRQFIGIGPNYQWSLGNMLDLKAYFRGGMTKFNGGELISTSADPLSSNTTDYHVLFGGFNEWVISAMTGFEAQYWLTSSLGIEAGAYFLKHWGLHPDKEFDLLNLGNIGIVYGESPITNVNDQMVIGKTDAMVIREAVCSSYSSLGINAGIVYRFGQSKNDAGCNNCNCPDDTHKVVVTVKDLYTEKIIPNADVAIKDIDGNIIATGTTNSFGAVDFGEISHGNYYAIGNIYGIETSTSPITKDEFIPNAVIQKEVVYNDLRFILKGRTINVNTRNPEPSVVVNLTNKESRNVKQDNSGKDGNFYFRLEKQSSYEVVGIKQNRLSEIEAVSTIGLNRSTTLFVDLELGVENIDCDKGAILDIKYEFDKWDILASSKFELDRLVRYLQDHPETKVELSSHTDSRGSHEYNQDLSQKRATSAVNYIMSRAIESHRIIAKGYGETRLLNTCSDGTKCTEDEHRINRRTEAKLLCY